MRFLPNIVKQKLKKNMLTYGSWLSIPSVTTAEIMAKSGFEFLVIDQEHGPFGTETTQACIAVIEGYEVMPFVRVEANDSTPIKKALEAGAYGIVAPMINSRPCIEKLIDSIYYAPKGKRGVGLSRAQDYGMSFKKYLSWYRKNVAVIAQIEHIDAIDNLDHIIKHKDLDATIIGPYDLSASMGYPGEFDRKEVKQALAHYEKVSRKMRKPFGYHIVHPDKKVRSEKIKKGYRFLVYGIDELFLAKGAREL